jgi:predicted negative regulator of RcsB-dependent stress response
MATPLDLEEQEQLDQLKHFWKQYGNAITWVLIVALSGFASWNFYQYWQHGKAVQASALFEEVNRNVKLGDNARVDRAFSDLKNGFESTVYAQQAGLLVSKFYYDSGKADASKTVLAWVVEKPTDSGYQAIAKLRLSGLLAEEGAYSEALKLLESAFPAGFQGLAQDRKGDIFLIQEQKSKAIAAYKDAYKLIDDRIEYRRLVEVKLNSLGVSPVADGTL